mmetsp:Transcript_40882/g.128094  ORF Transcript_40882/g.128094 Transcript_40882/m.128094 type:complete len:1750 (-) Transcript_40882:409-5658(-)|eukprot:CAMPEP_0118852632 /NCGR_PEP_ID=MMETSP1163-20130328/1553_1 /TAXON_ID=124430 /ORGANISM="Phaeomonas parva, Strain CCMP2877" /LENGTH=1749 /DNA_ID=CAMNT_0006785079 /DNA_START=322 /DNA_END=5571 /DNA_ORIENTATION=+
MKPAGGLTLLMALLSGMGGVHAGFEPLDCNLPLLDAALSCAPFSSLNVDTSQKVEIPCGACVTMDAAGELNLEGGLDVVGKLVFPADRSALKITAPFVVVQGELIVEQLPELHAPQADKLLEFHFVGTEDVIFTPHHDQTFSMCDAGCKQSKKPFIVAGGFVDFQGMDESCHTWSRLQSAGDAGAPVIAAPPSAPVAPAGCPDGVIAESFDALPLAGWDGMGSTESVEDGYYSLSSRPSGTSGPRASLPIDCISPGVPYLLKLRFRYRHSSSADAEFVVPYLKMIRYNAGGGNDWMNAPLKYARGNMANAPVDEWHDLEYALEFDEGTVDSSLVDKLELYIAPFSDVDVIDIDDFVLELAPPDAIQQSCDALLLDGASDYAYPFHPTGGMLNVISDGDGPSGSGAYFRNTLRSSTWSSALSQDINPDCLTHASIYDFSASVRVHAAKEMRVSFYLWIDEAVEETIVVCPPSAGEWVDCASKIRLEKDVEGAASVVLKTRVLGDDSSDLDVAELSMTYAGGRAVELTLEDPAGVSQCWGPGAEVLVTTHTINYEDSQLATIESVDANGVITLSSPVHKPITVEDDAMTAVEVALLSRNIVFSAAEDDVDDPLHGGHFIVMGTGAPVVQKIVGVETRGNGQQGKLGKYPLHFHMCGSVAGSTLSKNSVRNTKQRGIVVHGSDDLHLEENVLYDTRGHAVMLEDGGETGNVFKRNLGAVGHGVDIRISDDESDPTPATFWITNPKNTWVGNVAAGSKFSGFWFEVKTRVRGASANWYPDVVPNKLDLLLFTDNVSHGNAQGLQTYPQAGYRPESLAVFKNHRSYRNRGSGVFFHAGGRLSIDGGYISDNRIGVDIDMDHSDVISNTQIVGLSQSYKAVVDGIGHSASLYPAASFCDDDDADSALRGVRLDSYHDGSLFGATGSSLVNVAFSGFGTGSCAGSSALHSDLEDVRYFDTRNSLEGVSVTDDSTWVDLCGGEPQVAINDVDGSVIGQPGFIVADTDAIRSHPDCVGVPDSCAAFCPGVCLRTMTVMVPSYYERGALTLEVTGTTADGRAINPVFVQDFQTKPCLTKTQDSSSGRLFVTLPAGGSYQAQFFEDGEPAWPRYTDLKYEDEVGNCGADFAAFDIDPLTPDQCDSLVLNGDFEANAEYWVHAGLHGMEVASGGAGGSLFSLRAPNPADGGGAFVGLGQFLDTRCIEEGYAYTLSAQVKLVDASTGSLYECNPDAYSGAEDACPKGNLRFTNRLADPQHSYEIAGRMETVDAEWNPMTGTYVATAYDAAAHKAYLYITGVKAGIDIYIDDVSIVRSEVSSAPTARPTDAPTPAPSAEPTASPSALPEPEVPSPFEGSGDSVTFEGAGTISLATDSGADSSVMTKEAHAGDLSLTVEITGRSMVGSGYQPNVVLFFAPEATAIADVTTNDNGFGSFFEPTVVAWSREKIYYNPTNPDSLRHTWFNAKVRGEDGEYVSKSGGKGERLESGFLRLERTGGSVQASYSFDGASWTALSGAPVLLPEEYRAAPLKLGYRVLRSWKSAYDITTLPSIVSAGAVTPGAVTGPQSYFVEGNTERVGTTCDATGCTLALDTYNSAMLSTETFSGDVTFTAQVTNREIFGSGYQSGIALYFAPADATLATVPWDRNQDGAFNDYVLSVVSDKIYPTMDHTFTYVKTQTDAGRADQSGGDGWKNMEGYLKLERVGDVVSAYMSPNGNGWKAIGAPKTLPAAYAGAPIKLGLRTFRNWCSGYDISVMPTVEQS